MEETLSRRRVVRLSGAAALAALAGCGGNGSAGTETTTGGDETTAETGGAGSETAETGTAETGAAGAETADGGTVTPHGDIHAHGSMAVEINGEAYALADKPWNRESNTGDPHFHFHEGSDRYHLHSEGVTVGYALNSLPRVEASAETFAFRGRTYDASASDTDVRYLVGGEEVGLDHVVSESAPAVRVVVETDEATPDPVTTSS